ncbi:MAG: NAD(P)/FAD-dependent oxidoreductase [Candidatus Altiarchaeota archaeon]
MSYDAIVVGGGISGLLSALVLTKEEKDVILLERDSFVGGNVRSYELEGYRVDTGPHAITYINDGPLRELMDRYFVRVPEFLPYGKYYVRDSRNFLPFPWTMLAWARFAILPLEDRLQLIKVMGSAMTASAFRGVDLNASLYDYLRACRLSDRTWKFVDALSYFMSGKSMKEMPAWRMLKGARYVQETDRRSLGERFRKVLKLFSYDGAYHQGYPREGLGDILSCLLDSIPVERFQLKLDSNVESILVSDGKVRGVSTSDETFDSDLVIYSGCASQLPNLVGGLPEEYAKKLSSLEQSTSVSIWLGFGKRLPELDYVGSEIWFESGKPYWGMPTSNYNSRFAPDGKQLAVFTSYVEGDARKAESELLETVYSAIPSAEGNAEFKHVQVTHPEKAALSVNYQFPQASTPVAGLYLVGTDTDMRSMGITRAAFSVQTLVGLLKQKKTL